MRKNPGPPKGNAKDEDDLDLNKRDDVTSSLNDDKGKEEAPKKGVPPKDGNRKPNSGRSNPSGSKQNVKAPRTEVKMQQQTHARIRTPDAIMKQLSVDNAKTLSTVPPETPQEICEGYVRTLNLKRWIPFVLGNYMWNTMVSVPYKTRVQTQDNGGYMTDRTVFNFRDEITSMKQASDAVQFAVGTLHQSIVTIAKAGADHAVLAAVEAVLQTIQDGSVPLETIKAYIVDVTKIATSRSGGAELLQRLEDDLKLDSKSGNIYTRLMARYGHKENSEIYNIAVKYYAAVITSEVMSRTYMRSNSLSDIFERATTLDTKYNTDIFNISNIKALFGCYKDMRFAQNQLLSSTQLYQRLKNAHSSSKICELIDKLDNTLARAQSDAEPREVSITAIFEDVFTDHPYVKPIPVVSRLGMTQPLVDLPTDKLSKAGGYAFLYELLGLLSGRESNLTEITNVDTLHKVLEKLYEHDTDTRLYYIGARYNTKALSAEVPQWRGIFLQLVCFHTLRAVTSRVATTVFMSKMSENVDQKMLEKAGVQINMYDVYARHIGIALAAVADAYADIKALIEAQAYAVDDAAITLADGWAQIKSKLDDLIERLKDPKHGPSAELFGYLLSSKAGINEFYLTPETIVAPHNTQKVPFGFDLCSLGGGRTISNFSDFSYLDPKYAPVPLNIVRAYGEFRAVCFSVAPTDESILYLKAHNVLRYDHARKLVTALCGSQGVAAYVFTYLFDRLDTYTMIDAGAVQVSLEKAIALGYLKVQDITKLDPNDFINDIELAWPRANGYIMFYCSVSKKKESEGKVTYNTNIVDDLYFDYYLLPTPDAPNLRMLASTVPMGTYIRHASLLTDVGKMMPLMVESFSTFLSARLKNPTYSPPRGPIASDEKQGLDVDFSIDFD